MSEASFISKLRNSIDDYEAAIGLDPAAKDTPLTIANEPLPVSREKLANIWRGLPAPATLLGLFSHAKHGLSLCIKNKCLTDVSEYVPSWVHTCVDAGAYKDCETFADECIRSNVLRDRMGPDGYLSVLFSRAKALRNRGRFEDAQSAYREIIRLADKMESPVDLSFGLLLIGKLYGNYLGQRSLFSSFVGEAKRRLEELDLNGYSEDEQRRITRGKAICYDALGQAHRAFTPDTVDHWFIEARRLNKMIGRQNGVSRNNCHHSRVMFQRADSQQDKADHLSEFVKDGMYHLTQQKPPDERGLAVRSVQLASMLHEMGDELKARAYLEAGKRFARLYSQHKTLVEAARVESEIYQHSDPRRAADALKKGRDDALSYRLEIQESNFNWEMITRLSPHREFDLPPVELLKRNHEIFMRLIGEVQQAFRQLYSSEELGAEFRLLSTETKSKFRENLLLDYEHIVKKLDRNFRSLLAFSHGDGH